MPEKRLQKTRDAYLPDVTWRQPDGSLAVRQMTPHLARLLSCDHRWTWDLACALYVCDLCGCITWTVR